MAQIRVLACYPKGMTFGGTRSNSTDLGLLSFASLSFLAQGRLGG